MNKESNVFILYTGGTIGMAPTEAGNPASPLEPKPLSDLIKWVPGWDGENSAGKFEIALGNGIKLGFGSFDEPLDSSNITPTDWLTIAEEIKKVYEQYDGFVILHGTDTMAYTASGLAFIFENLAKPVVVTGSQLAISDERTDAVMNLVNSVHIAGWKSTGLPCIPEVVVCFADRLLRGCRTSKVSSTAWAGFDSPNFPRLGAIGEHIKINEDLLLPAPASGTTFQVNTSLNTNVMDITMNPGMKASHLETIMAMKDIDAIMLRTYGAGNAPDKESFLNTIQKITSEKTIVNVTQCQQGMVEMGLYAASAGMLERGVISGLDMTPEAVLTKLYTTLGTKIGAQVVTQMQVSQRGEQSENLFDLRYGKCGNKDEDQTKFDHYLTPDRRFKVRRMSRAVVRFQGLGVIGGKKGKEEKIQVFMNKPSAIYNDTERDPRCIAEFVIDGSGKANNSVQVVSDEIARSSIGDGDITLSVRAKDGVRFWFEGLYLALFAKAS